MILNKFYFQKLKNLVFSKYQISMLNSKIKDVTFVTGVRDAQNTKDTMKDTLKWLIKKII